MNPTESLPIETSITFFLLNYCKRQDLKISTQKGAEELDFPQKTTDCLLAGQKVTFTEEIPTCVSDCTLPALRNGCLVRAGLCTVLRHIVKKSHEIASELDLIHLLGHKGICLKSCAEVSVWTKFCEVEMPKFVSCLQQIQRESVCGDVPYEIEKLENHMKQPPIIPNITKRRRQARKMSSSESLEHVYAEGTDMTLTDLILFPCITQFLNSRKNTWAILCKRIPLIVKWYQRMQNLTPVKEASQKSGLPWLELPEVIVPETAAQDSHVDVRDPNKRKFKAHTSEVAAVMKKLKDLGVNPTESTHPCGNDVTLPWEQLPATVHPVEGELPLSRVARKCEQLENLARAVTHIASSGNIIVDFCSGGGHLGILLAHLLPQCQILLVENKEESLERGQRRIEELGLTNVMLYQCNMDYFTGPFDIGVCLHACGVATDLVLQRCLDNRASFVICPCCYGSIQNTHTMTYPRSLSFSQKNIQYQDYLVLGHAADQTQVGIKQAADGKACMLLIDRDRALLAQEHGYDVTLCSLNPLSCSPKNDLLIGQPPDSS